MAVHLADVDVGKWSVRIRIRIRVRIRTRIDLSLDHSSYCECLLLIMGPRRSHRKSRNGCPECKTRRLKVRTRGFTATLLTQRSATNDTHARTVPNTAFNAATWDRVILMEREVLYQPRPRPRPRGQSLWSCTPRRLFTRSLIIPPLHPQQLRL